MSKANLIPAMIVTPFVLSLLGCTDAPNETAFASLECLSLERIGDSVLIGAGEYRLGETRFYREESPVVTVRVKAFDIDATEVTNGQFQEFVKATGYITRAERGLPETEFDHLPNAMRVPGSAVFQAPLSGEQASGLSWWKFVDGASWKTPDGPGSTIEGRENHPVVHIAYEDAEVYADWKGRRLPSEAEWEAAARGGLIDAPYAWGEEKPDDLDAAAANIWQGIFPYINQESDGYSGLAPVGCYAPNGFGLYDMIGNVWEWTADPYFPNRAALQDENPSSTGFDPAQPGVAVGAIKGGSYLCAESYCVRFRPAARQAQDLSLGASHIGFRTAADAEIVE